MNELSTEIKKIIEHWIEKYPYAHRRSAILPILVQVQKHCEGYIDLLMLERIANFMKLPLVYIQEVVTFYSLLRKKKPAKYECMFCTNVSCMLRGAYRLMDVAKQAIVRYTASSNYQEAARKNIFSIGAVECLGACVYAPVLQINGEKYIENLDESKVITLIEERAHGN